MKNADIEMRWIEAWNDLFDLCRDRRDVPCMLPDGSIVDAEACKGWLQDQVYHGHSVRVAEGWINGVRGVFAARGDNNVD